MSVDGALNSSSAEETVALGRALAAVLRPGDVVSLTGDLGAGKTQLVKGVAEGLGVKEQITSPTFAILAVHPGTEMPLYHFDLYRLERAVELEDIDFRGVTESDGASMVEWGERFREELPADHLAVSITYDGDEGRKLELSPSGPRSAEIAGSWARGVGAW